MHEMDAPSAHPRSNAMTFDPSSKTRLTPYDLGRFPSDRLFDRIARAVCTAGCLPRKELYEAWEMARRVRRRFRGGRIVDVAGGHGLLAHVMLLLDDSSTGAFVVDPAAPPSGDALDAALTSAWPRLAGRVHRVVSPIEAFTFEPGDVVVSSHACGALSDRVLDSATGDRGPGAGCSAAVLSRCRDL
jgi:hypothetical protein